MTCGVGAARGDGATPAWSISAHVPRCSDSATPSSAIKRAVRKRRTRRVSRFATRRQRQACSSLHCICQTMRSNISLPARPIGSSACGTSPAPGGRLQLLLAARDRRSASPTHEPHPLFAVRSGSCVLAAAATGPVLLRPNDTALHWHANLPKLQAGLSPLRQCGEHGPGRLQESTIWAPVRALSLLPPSPSPLKSWRMVSVKVQVALGNGPPVTPCRGCVSPLL